MNMDRIKFSYYFGCRERVLAKEYTKLLDFLKNEGNSYDAIELLEMFGEQQLFENESETLEFVTLLKANGISVSCHSVYIDIYDNFDEAEDYLKKQIDVAVNLGSPYLHHTLKPSLEITSSDTDTDALLRKGLPLLKNVADYAKSKGIKMLYEPQGMYFNGEGLKKLIDALLGLGIENVGVCIDLGNTMFVDYTAEQSISDFMPYVCHVHIKDYKIVSDGEGDYRSAGGKCFYEIGYGQGNMKNDECIRTLLDAGYNGYFSTELNPRGSNSDDAGIDAISKIRKKWQ